MTEQQQQQRARANLITRVYQAAVARSKHHPPR